MTHEGATQMEYDLKALVEARANITPEIFEDMLTNIALASGAIAEVSFTYAWAGEGKAPIEPANVADMSKDWHRRVNAKRVTGTSDDSFQEAYLRAGKIPGLIAEQHEVRWISSCLIGDLD